MEIYRETEIEIETSIGENCNRALKRVLSSFAAGVGSVFVVARLGLADAVGRGEEGCRRAR
jgi:hypothetical protein